MEITKKDKLCPCNSGLNYLSCCGTKGRTALNSDMLAKVGSDGKVVEGELAGTLPKSLDVAATSPDLFFARYNFLEERAYMVKMSPRWYEESVFLDPDRIKGTCVIEANFKWLQSLADSITLQQTPIIYHTAFCGSTLMSQALHATFNSLPLREPECLSNTQELLRSDIRTDEYKNYWLDVVLKFLSKRYHPNQPAVIKTNDYSNPMMIEILDRYNDTPSLFMYTPLDEFVAGCLKAQNRREWIKSRYFTCAPYAKKLFADDTHNISIAENAYAEMAAFYWSYNIALFHQAWRRHPKQLCSLNFNTMLTDHMSAIEACGKWFKLERSTNENISMKIETLFGVYSKNSTKEYSPKQRQIDIQVQIAGLSEEVLAAKQLAKKLLSDDYPSDGLPGDLLSH